MDLSAAPYQSLRAHLDGAVLTLTLARPEQGNPLTRQLVDELRDALARYPATVVVLDSAPEVFCVGADFAGIAADVAAARPLHGHDPEALYALWRQLAHGPFVSVAHVRGKVNAGGVGLAAACDIVLASETAVFSLSEMLFGLLPACVLPFLVRRVGMARANTLTLATQPLTARQAEQWGLVDACDADSVQLLRRHLLRLKRLGAPAIARYKAYAAELEPQLTALQAPAVRANLAAFSDPANLAHISRYVSSGRFPWEA